MSLLAWFASEELYTDKNLLTQLGVLMEFLIGDNVQLESADGPCMTVIGMHPNGYLACCWFDGTELQEVIVPTDALMICMEKDENARLLRELIEFK